MQRFLVRTLSSLAMLGLAALAIAGCGSSEDPPAGATKLAFKLTDAGCDPHNAEVPAGPIVFEVENGGSTSVTELEVLDGETILGELENISEGLSGSFSLTLEKGRYTLRCNGGEEEDGTLTVSGGSSAHSSPATEKRSPIKKRSPITATTWRRTPTSWSPREGLDRWDDNGSCRTRLQPTGPAAGS